MTLKSSQCNNNSSENSVVRILAHVIKVPKWQSCQKQTRNIVPTGKDSFDSSDEVREVTPTPNTRVNLPELNFLQAFLISGPMTTKGLEAKTPESGCSDAIVLTPTS
ncbi:hypothetical protein BPOR_0502g00090 [Botrytis porri]|uniref:Uncharacterized protein n=1 Tax=Botrytis porri TaxID=87229 RepID=A0A4Z1KRE1_9HELO|nr:hypothetical protein BPOR_0502g00090 [Botrytis porri]